MKAFKLITILALVVLGLAAIAFLLFWLNVPRVVFAVGLCLVVSIILTGLPLLISYVQTTAKERQLEKLRDIAQQPVAQTRYYAIALMSLKSVRPANPLEAGYTLPIVIFSFVLMFSCLMVLLGAFPEVDDLFKRNTFLLGGMVTLNETDTDKIALYQKGTLLVGAFAFIGSYVYMLGRLLDRINNNDIYPISYYYYVARFAIATLVAMVLRHVFALMSTESGAILLVAFAIGFAPDLFIVVMLRRAFQYFKISGNQNDPAEDVLPTNMSLLMIEGMTRDKIDRLTELGIDNAQVLAEQNPFMIWPRLPYSLWLIVDWIAQAQLYRFAQEKGTQALRQRGISTIYDLFIALEDKAAAPEIAMSAGLLPSAIDAYIAALRVNPSFARLKEVREKLAATDAPPSADPAKRPAPPEAAKPPAPAPAEGPPGGVMQAVQAR